MEINYLPLNEIANDKLNFKDKAVEISNFVNGFRCEVPYAISINGSWGKGKSTMLNFIEELIDKNKCEIIRFNPWMISGKDELILALFEEM